MSDAVIIIIVTRFADKAVDTQREQFRSWGVMADWTQPYLTKSTQYVTRQLEMFYRLYEKGFIFRSSYFQCDVKFTTENVPGRICQSGGHLAARRPWRRQSWNTIIVIRAELYTSDSEY